MRSFSPIAALLSVLLGACASAPDTPNRVVPQSGSLKVHPGLLGQPVPLELQPQESPAPAAPTAPATSTKPEDNAKPGNLKLDGMGLRTQRSVYFDLKSVELKAEFTAMLQAHAGYLAQHPKARIRVEGNADERGPDGFNRKLGAKRAETVKQALVSQGVPERQVKIATLGETKPKLKGHDEESWAENRRADLVYEKDK